MGRLQAATSAGDCAKKTWESLVLMETWKGRGEWHLRLISFSSRENYSAKPPTGVMGEVVNWGSGMA